MATRSSTPILLALFVLLFAMGPAPAAAVELPPVDPDLLALEDGEPEAEAAADEVEEEGFEECEEVEEGFEECEEVEAEAARSGREECLLRSARAHASVDSRGEKLKLTIGYTAYEPAKAKIEIRKGTLKLASAQRHLGKSGVIRLTKRLGDARMAKLETARRLSVRVRIAGTPRDCRRVGYLSPRLVLFPR
jgi:hypothetical protein